MRSRARARPPRRRPLLLLLIAAAWAGGVGPAAAQEFFPRFDFHLDGQYVAVRDERFNWVFDFGGEVEVLRTSRFTTAFIANYEAIAGEQFRRFDVNQGNYLLEGALLFRVAGIEAGPVWHHVSRHLSDRAKRFPVDWNMIALRARDTAVRGRLETSWTADVRASVTTALVDYDWEIESGGRVGVRARPRLVVIGGGTWRLVGVDGSRGRGSQVEARGEIAVRLEGRAAAAEVFAGAERRVDPYPAEFGVATWFLAGFRITSR